MAEDPFNGGESDVPVGFDSAEDQNHPDGDIPWVSLISGLRVLEGQNGKFQFLMVQLPLGDASRWYNDLLEMLQDGVSHANAALTSGLCALW